MLTTAERNEMLLTISDLSKDVYGYRVRLDYSAMSDDELTHMWDSFMDAAQERIVQDDIREKQAFADYDAHLVKMMNDHGITYDVAIRWDLQANDVDMTNRQDVEFYFWNIGLSFQDQHKYAEFAMDNQALVA